MSFVAFGPLQRGILLDKFDPENPPRFDEVISAALINVFSGGFADAQAKLAQLKTRFGATTEDLSAVAQRYVLNHSNVACTIPGFRNQRQVAYNLAAAGRSLSAQDMALSINLFAA